MNRSTRFSLIGIAVLAIFTFAALPFARFALQTVSAIYIEETPFQADPLVAECLKAATLQVRFFGDVTYYSDADLNNAIATLKGSALYPQKFIICGDQDVEEQESLAVVFANSLVFVVNNGNIVGRAAKDSE